MSEFKLIEGHEREVAEWFIGDIFKHGDPILTTLEKLQEAIKGISESGASIEDATLDICPIDTFIAFKRLETQEEYNWRVHTQKDK